MEIEEVLFYIEVISGIILSPFNWDLIFSVYFGGIISRDDNDVANLFQAGKDAANPGQLDGDVTANVASFVRDKVAGAAHVSRLREHADAVSARWTHLEQSAGRHHVRRRLHDLLHSLHHSDQRLSTTNGAGKIHDLFVIQLQFDTLSNTLETTKTI